MVGWPILTQHVLLHCDGMLWRVHQMLRMLWAGEANCLLNFYLRRSRQVYVSLTLLLLLGDIWLLAAADAREDKTTS